MPRSLAGRRIAVTRGRSGEDALSATLLALGAAVLDAPSIVIAPPRSFADLDGALRELERTDWIAFASPNAVERTVERAAEIGVAPEALARPSLAAVGEATARRLRRLVRSPDLVPAGARGEALAAALAGRVRGQRVLVPRAEEGRPELVDGLTRAGAQVVAPVAYRTVAAPREALEPLVSALERGEVDAVVFASPSAVRSVLGALGGRASLLRGTVLAVMGPTTAGELRGRGLGADVQPAHSTGPALAEALADFLGPAGGG